MFISPTAAKNPYGGKLIGDSQKPAKEGLSSSSIDGKDSVRPVLLDYFLLSVEPDLSGIIPTRYQSK